MSKQWYGNLTNRLEEGKNYTGREIRVGDDITMYSYSDRDCYYVTAVESQKRIKVKRYYVCVDRSKPGGMGHQDWMYFKDRREFHAYIHVEGWTDEDYAQYDREETWVFRYNKWMLEHTYTEENYCTEREKKSLEKNGFYKRYFDLSGKVSFGVRDYYYDWEF